MPFIKFLYFFTLIILLSTCVVHKSGNETTEPKQFKTEIPFEIRNGKLFIPTYWDKDKTKQFVAFDTHAPTWADSSILNNNYSMSRKKNLFFKTRTIDGRKLTGSVYVCDSIRLGSVKFNDVTIYDISSSSNHDSRTGINAVFGDNLISMGIWKIDFENRLLIFTSSLDSINGLQNAVKLPSEFSENIIMVDAVFSNHIHRKLSVDFGYNGSVILPKQFAETDTSSKKVLTNGSVLNTLAGIHYTNDFVLAERINIGSNNYSIIVHFNEAIKENLLGLGFFLQFKFVILDYKNKAIYVSDEVRTAF